MDINIEELKNQVKQLATGSFDSAARVESICNALDRLQAENAELRRELEEARKDAERLAWAIQQDDNAEELYAAVLNSAGDQDAIRCAIDAAREQQG